MVVFMSDVVDMDSNASQPASRIALQKIGLCAFAYTYVNLRVCILSWVKYSDDRKEHL